EPEQQSLRRQLADLRTILAKAEAGTPRHSAAVKLVKEVTDLLEAHRTEVLNLGAACRLLVQGELAVVLPLDDLALLDGGAPSLKGEFDSKAVARREDAMVKNAF